MKDGYQNLFVDEGREEPQFKARMFNIWGQPSNTLLVSEGASPITTANPVTAALPDGTYAVAWSDFDGDGSDLGVALRRVSADGTLGALRAANLRTEFSQLNPDMIWTGSELVVAWEDYANAFNGPDLRYRTFDGDLNPTSQDVVLAASELPEAAVALAPVDGSWAAAYREGAVDGGEYIVVKVGDDSFRAGPVLGGPMDDRPALVELDATHLLVVFSAGTDPGGTGTNNVSRIRYAVIDINGPLAPQVLSLDPLDDIFTYDAQVSHLSPAAVQGPDGTYVAWRSEARPGDSAGDQIWLKYISWNPMLPVPLDLGQREMLMPRVSEGSMGDQRTPALALVGLPPSGALAMAWDDYGHTQGADAGDPAVVVHYAPLHERAGAGLRLFEESWTGTTGASWPSRWTTRTTGAGTPQLTIQNNQARVNALGGGVVGYGWVNEHTARDVDLLTKVRFAINGANGALVARLDEEHPDRFLGARFGAQLTAPWQIFAKVDAQTEVLATGVQPGLFQNFAQDLDYWMRFRVQDGASQTINLDAKIWLDGLPEPSEWNMHATATSGSLAVQNFYGVAGRFGLYGSEAQANRSTDFDDFRATFYEGTATGDPSAIAMRAPLQRDKALYRQCTSSDPCDLGEGTCYDTGECAMGLTCQSGQNQVASHAKTCSVAHCANRQRDEDEVRVDCGGADCAPCSCTTTATFGSASYCSTCPCGIGDSSCSNNAQCVPGMTCKAAGPKYGLASGVSVCTPFHCLNRALDAMPLEGEGETNIDCGGDCGDCYVDPTNGSLWHCRVYAPCGAKQGACQHNDECVPGTVCGSKGDRFGLPAGTSVCVAPHCTDQVKNYDETAKDCGGVDCGTCP
jgi:hypothetical protein